MRAYFDKENIESFLLSREDEGFMECFRVLNKHLDIFFNIPEEEFETDEYCQIWRMLDVDGGSQFNPDCIDFKDCHFQINNDSLSSTDPEDYTAIYFLSNDEKSTEYTGNNLVVSLGKELDTLKKLLFDGENKFEMRLRPKRGDFSTPKPWDVLSSYILPCTDIIIADSYLLGTNANWYTNLIALINILCNKNKSKNVNIVLLSETKYKDKDKKEKLDEKYYDKVRTIIKNKLSNITANISFVTVDVEYGNKNSYDEHDRTVFTNYRSFISHSGFYMYDKDGKCTSHGRYFAIWSLVETDNYKDAMDFIRDMQTHITDVKDEKIKGDIYKDPDMNAGSKLSNFLTFY